MERIRECIDKLFVKTNVEILYEIAQDILKVELEGNIPNMRFMKRLQTDINDSEDKEI